jgi:hypothetical protein
MNLDYAAYLLNENYILNEDAGSEGQKGARKWFEQNMMNMELGGMGGMTPNQFQREAEATFGHPLNDALGIRDKNVYKYLPGAVRIAVNECGWLSEHEDKKMMDNLILMYAYAYLEWKDGIAEGRPGPQRGQPYAGKYNRDFNGLRYKGLYDEIGQANINATKTRLETANQVELTPEERAAREAEAAARAAAEEEERRRRETAGAYHIEFIPNYETSQQWYDYTNPKSDSCGCHWCITQTRDNWDSYITNGGKCAYYCWKAESKEALMAMNSDERWFSRWPRDRYPEAPLNDYGKSLICIMVYPGDDGRPKFAHASSRYNHYNPGGNWDSSSRYGDGMVPQGDRGFQEILGILGITAEEFYEKFPFRTADGEQAVDHSRLYTALNSFRERAASVRGKKLYDILSRFDDATRQGEDIIKIRDGGEYNYVNSSGNLLSPTRWFKETKSTFAKGNAVGVRFKNPQGAWVWNLLDRNGNLLLAKNVYEVRFFEYNDTIGPYVKVGMKIGDDELFNVININNGNFLLRKPAFDVMLSKAYSSSIPIKETRESDWILIDLKGKKININVPLKRVRTDISIDYGNGKTFIYADINQNGKRGIINKKLSRMVYTLKNGEEVYAMNMYGFVIRGNNKYQLFNDKGELLHTLTNGNRIYLGEDCKYAWFKNGRIRFYDMVENRQLTDIVDAGADDCRGYKGLFFANRTLYFNGQEIADDLYSRTFVPLKGAFKDYVYIQTNSSKSLFNAVTGERLPNKCVKVYEANNNYIAIHTEGTTLVTYDENFNELDRITDIAEIRPLNFGCVLVRERDTQKPYNIIGPDGYRLFELNFDDVLTAGFDQEGIATIKCGNNDYFINIEGDVSRARELMAESMQSKLGPMLMEYSAPKANAKFNWHNIAANFLD